MSELPEPLTPPDCDLRGFKYMPLDIVRLFGSEFHATANDAEWRAGVTLWLKSFHQMPAGSLPDEDTQLARLAEMGRDLRAWRRVKVKALHGWARCSDGRLYHAVVAEKVNEAWEERLAYRARKTARTEAAKAAADARWRQTERNDGALPGAPESNAPRMRDASETQSESNADAMPKGKGREGKQERAAQPLGKVEEPRVSAPDIDLDDLSDRLLAVAKPGTWPLAVAPSLAPIPKLLADGCDLERDIVPTVATMADAARRAGKKIGSWSYFEKAILEARDARRAGKSSPSPKGEATPMPRLAGTPDDWPWQIQLTPEKAREWWLAKRWPATFGPEPGQAGCLVPKRFVDEWMATKGAAA